ncbi:hypothetical protein B0G80_5659 [Paraburkholderia sp. BL6669N2]|uniref:hypothetical protein n=1 Tax=Paraburkholderia sp. BL6669N2 TaxID=1938807 RepID=UPI000E36E073|nr:hypothetical protein [Paraburkholderia sp. BL6669N2]REG49303.1 hypothetical protein B0G80_5659 [Paraburkholderia sp. BL6669N2]
MHLANRFIAVALFACAFVENATGTSQAAIKIYTDEHVRFSYPANRYAKIEKLDTSQTDFHAYSLRLKGVEAEDVLTVCEKNIHDCGTDAGLVQPYWYDAEGTLMLFSATTAVTKKSVIPGETVYEAFPACPATEAGGASAYAGDCYELVASTQNKTISLTYWIGPKSRHRSRRQAVKAATEIIRSVEDK